MAHILPYFYFGTHHTFGLLRGFAYVTPTLLAPVFPFPAYAFHTCPHSSVILQYRNFNLLSIDYAFRIALGPDLPRADQLYSGNLRYSAEGFSPSSRYSFRHSLFDAIHSSLRYCFVSHPMLLYQLPFGNS